MRLDRGSPARSATAFEPIRIELYGADGPALRPAVDRPLEPARGGGGGAGGGGGGRRPFATLAALAALSTIAVLGAVALVAPTDERAAPSVAAEVGGADAESGQPARATDLVTLPPALASPLPFPGGAVEAGRYRSDLLGIPIEFTIAGETALRTARPGTIVLTPVGTAATDLEGAPHAHLIRVAGWNTREEAADRSFRGVGGIAPDDIDAWAGDNDVIVDQRGQTVIDGRPAEVVDLRVDPASPLGQDICVVELRPCFWFASVAEDITPIAAIRLDYALYGPTTMRLWLIEVDGDDPVAVLAAAVAGDESWLDRFEESTIATMVIGESAIELLAGSGGGVPAPR